MYILFIYIYTQLKLIMRFQFWSLDLGIHKKWPFGASCKWWLGSQGMNWGRQKGEATRKTHTWHWQMYRLSHYTNIHPHVYIQISISFNTSGTLCSHMFSFPSPRCRENQRKLGTPGGIEQVKEASKMLPSHDHCQNLTVALCTPSGSCCKRLQIEAVVNDVEVNEEFIRLFLDVPLYYTMS